MISRSSMIRPVVAWGISAYASSSAARCPLIEGSGRRWAMSQWWAFWTASASSPPPHGVRKRISGERISRIVPGASFQADIALSVA